MKWIEGKPREQLILYSTCLDEIISPDNETRLIDAFVNNLELKRFGFNTHAFEDGRPQYHSSDLLKLFIYGYMTFKGKERNHKIGKGRQTQIGLRSCNDQTIQGQCEC